ncbi:MAG: hypothetical protein JXB26_14105 [Candidatus Aminicenantes bacterium]|nr:hypothetical protein [Candidatus Aminicenantes bacterium]
MKKNVFYFSLFLLTVLFLSPAEKSVKTGVEPFLSRFIQTLKDKNLEDLASFYSSSIYSREKQLISSMFSDFDMKTVDVLKTTARIMEDGDTRTLLKFFFQNDYSVFIEDWNLTLRETEEGWRILQNSRQQDPTFLYRLQIPSQRMERVKRIDVDHADLHLTFSNAVVFYDNIPQYETALLVMGPGHFRFSPSPDNEKHQLQLIYKNEILDDKLEYAYFRFSDSFFRDHVKIIKEEAPGFSPEQTELDAAAALFAKHNYRSFTIENSLNGELLSSMPQGDEAVFEFKGVNRGEFTYVYSPFSEEEINFYEWTNNRIVNLYSPPAKEKGKKIFVSFHQKFDVTDYSLDIDLKPPDSRVTGKAVVTFISKIEGLDRLIFKLRSDLHIERILDEKGRELFFTKDNHRQNIYIYLLQPAPLDHSTTIAIHYQGNVDFPREESDINGGYLQNNTHVIRMPYFDTYHYSKSQFWYPTPPENDYFSARLTLKVPPDYSAVSHGTLSDSSPMEEPPPNHGSSEKGHSVYIYENPTPLKDLSCIVGRFKKIEEDLTSIPLQYFRTNEFIPSITNILKDTREIIQFYENIYGNYPYGKLSIVHRLWPFCGGHSPASFIILDETPRSISRYRFGNINSPVDLSRWRESFLAHEIAHQWWGQAVSPAGYRDQWISEGLATFSSILFLKHRYGEKDFKAILKKLSMWVEDLSHMGAITMGARISHLDFNAYQAVVYNKSALVLNMLRDMLGDDVFSRGIKTFFDRHKYNAVTTKNFCLVFSEISGRDLNPFFNLWFDSYHLPQVRVFNELEKKGGSYELRFVIEQQDRTFIFPLWIEWKCGKQKFREKIIVDENPKTVTYRLPSKPGKIKVNPDKAVPGSFH